MKEVKFVSDIMTIRDVAKFLRVHEMTVYRHVIRGKMAGFKVGGQWRFRKADLDKLFVSGKCK